MIKPAKEKFTLYQGATWVHIWEVHDEDDNILPLVGCTARLQARVNQEDEEPVVDLEGEVNELAGQVRFTATPDMTVDAVWESAGYDAELYWPNGVVDKLSFGIMILRPEYTR